jgi:hypothetical protein
VSILAAIVAIGVALMTFPNAVWKWSGEMSGLMTSLFESPSRAKTPTKLPRLVVKAQKGFVNEPLPLGVLLNNATGGEKVILAGLPIGTRLSAGTPMGLTSWQMLTRDVVDALVYPPNDFVGLMIAVIDLRAPGDWLMDSQIIRLEWIHLEKPGPTHVLNWTNARSPAHPSRGAPLRRAAGRGACASACRSARTSHGVFVR